MSTWVSVGESVQVLGVGGCESASELSLENSGRVLRTEAEFSEQRHVGVG